MPECPAVSAGHLDFASCTRFSPKTRWPAAMTGAMASDWCVLETAISVTEFGSRAASAQAWASAARTCASAPEAAAISSVSLIVHLHRRCVARPGGETLVRAGAKRILSDLVY